MVQDIDKDMLVGFIEQNPKNVLCLGGNKVSCFDNLPFITCHLLNIFSDVKSRETYRRDLENRIHNQLNDVGK